MTFIVNIPKDEPWEFKENDDGEIMIPHTLADLAIFLDTLWTMIFEENKLDSIPLYNEAAERYNRVAKFEAITIIDNFKKQKQMATKKAAGTAKAGTAKKAAPKKAAPKKAAVKKAAPKKAAVKKETDEPVKVKEKKLSQRDQIVALAKDGKTIDEIVTLTGIRKGNVSWHYKRMND